MYSLLGRLTEACARVHVLEAKIYRNA